MSQAVVSWREFGEEEDEVNGREYGKAVKKLLIENIIWVGDLVIAWQLLLSNWK